MNFTLGNFICFDCNEWQNACRTYPGWGGGGGVPLHTLGPSAVLAKINVIHGRIFYRVSPPSSNHSSNLHRESLTVPEMALVPRGAICTYIVLKGLYVTVCQTQRPQQQCGADPTMRSPHPALRPGLLPLRPNWWAWRVRSKGWGGGGRHSLGWEPASGSRQAGGHQDPDGASRGPTGDATTNSRCVAVARQTLCAAPSISLGCGGPSAVVQGRRHHC